jgi:dipeptidyl aminopeptidase/acylaminoacyl peptidase
MVDPPGQRPALELIQALLALTIVIFDCGTTLATAGGRQILSVKNEIETARFKINERKESVFVSADGTGYVSMLIRGDVASDGVWGELVYGKLDSLDGAKPQTVARLFTKGLGSSDGFGSGSGSGGLLVQAKNCPVWLDNERVALLWESPNHGTQIVSVNVKTHEVTQLTHETDGIVAFLAGPNGSFVYDVSAKYSREASKQLLDKGFSVTSTDAMVLLGGIVDGASAFDFGMERRVVFTVHGTDISSHPVAAGSIYGGLSFLQLGGQPGEHLFSPDGKQVILDAGVAEVPREWSAYQGFVAESLRAYARNPHGMRARWVNQLMLVDVATGDARSLWDAPGPTFNPMSRIAWSPDGVQILIAPTLLPPGSNDAAGLSGRAAAIVDAATGKYVKLPLDPADAEHIISVAWLSSEVIDMHLLGGESIRYEKKDNHWHKAVPAKWLKPSSWATARTNRVRIELRQGLNDPPALYAVDLRTGQYRIVLDPNPGLRTDFALGNVEFMDWVNTDGREWQGRLYYPAHYQRGVRYPLVIQTHGFADKGEYSLTGQGGLDGVALGPEWSAFLAQPLASIGIAVLQIGGPVGGPRPFEEMTDIERIKSIGTALQTAAEHLVSAGLVEGSKVGITGHSALGRVIEHALVDSEFPYAAAIAGDYADNNYMNEALFNWDHDFGRSFPFADGLKTWLDESPAFSVERVRTPLQLLLYSGSEGNTTLLWHWEMFSRLRFLHKPVEYYVMPDIQHGSHENQNPRQQLALQGRALDWWRFWLLDEEDAGEAKREQYASWHVLRDQHTADLSLPRSPRLEWVSRTAADPPR